MHELIQITALLTFAFMQHIRNFLSQNANANSTIHLSHWLSPIPLPITIWWERFFLIWGIGNIEEITICQYHLMHYYTIYEESPNLKRILMTSSPNLMLAKVSRYNYGISANYLKSSYTT